MTEETELKIEQLNKLADSVDMGKEFRNVPMPALVHLTAIPVISGNELKYFLEGFFMGFNSKAFIPSDIND